MDRTDQDVVDNSDVTVVSSRQPDSWTFAPKIGASIRAQIETADVVHIHSIQTYTSTIAMRIARQSGTPYVIEPHGALDVYHWHQKHQKKHFYAKVVDRYGVAGLSGALYSSPREMSEGELVLQNVPSYSLPLGVEESLFASIRNVSEKEREVLFLGRVTEKKRLDLVLHALADSRIQATGASLVVAGPVDDRLGYDPIQLVRSLGITDRVRFLGQVDRKTRARLLSTASVFVLPSEDESFGMAVVEAAAAGCPIVASIEVGVASQLSKAGGLKLAALNAESVATGIEELLLDPVAGQRQGLAGRAFAHSHFTWRESARMSLECYNQVTQ